VRKSKTAINRDYRRNNPLRYAYMTLRDNSKRRGKFFDLTFEQFCAFAVETEYMLKKGIFQKSYHIDRIREEDGYTLDNIQVLTNEDNVKKYLRYHYDDYERRMEFSTETVKQLQTNDNPF
jgi:hypothetical protein